MKIPKRIDTIKRHIQNFEKQLKYEKRTYGCYDDGAGLRYLIGPYYLLAGDIEGALKHFKWFNRVFNDDYGEPCQYMCWTLALFKSGDLKKSYDKFLQTLFMNPFVIAKIIGIEYIMPFKSGSNLPTKEWAEWIEDEFYLLWDADSKAWLKESFYNENTQNLLNRYNEIGKKLELEPVGETRSKLVEEFYALQRSRS